MDPDARVNLKLIDFPTVGRRIKTPVLIEMRERQVKFSGQKRVQVQSIRDNSEVHII